MINVLLVDDDYSQRGYMKNIIDWTSEDCRICGEADNGCEALERMEELRPELVFLDINMPQMDGLELLKKMHAASIHMKIVVVSGYDEFEYAKEAMDYGVCHYILKPVDETELLEVVRKVCTDINNEIRSKLEFSMLTEKLKQSLPLLREKFLSDLVSGRIECTSEAFWEKISFLELELGDNTYISAIIEFDDMNKSIRNEKNRQILKLAIMEICGEIIPRYGKSAIFNDEADKVTLILEVCEEERSLQLESLSELLQRINSGLGINVTIACGGTYELESIYKSYNEALNSLKSKTYLGCNRVLDYLELEAVEERYVYIADKYREQFIIYIRKQKLDELKSLVHEILTSYKTRKTSVEYMRIVALEMVTIGFTYIASMGYSISSVLGETYSPMDELLCCNTFEGLQEYLEDYFTGIIGFISRISTPKMSELVTSAKEYIDKTYGDYELSLEKIASNLFVHPVYLSSTFKKDFGKTVTEYIIEIRMEKALKLLHEDKNTPVSDIAAAVGYTDYYYFSKSFKKFYGFSPADMRKDNYKTVL